MDESAGSADKEMDTIKSSLEYKLNALQETWTGTIQNIMKRSDLGFLIDGLTKGCWRQQEKSNPEMEVIRIYGATLSIMSLMD